MISELTLVEKSSAELDESAAVSTVISGMISASAVLGRITNDTIIIPKKSTVIY